MNKRRPGAGGFIERNFMPVSSGRRFNVIIRDNLSPKVEKFVLRHEMVHALRKEQGTYRTFFTTIEEGMANRGAGAKPFKSFYYGARQQHSMFNLLPGRVNIDWLMK